MGTRPLTRMLAGIFRLGTSSPIKYVISVSDTMAMSTPKSDNKLRIYFGGENWKLKCQMGKKYPKGEVARVTESVQGIGDQECAASEQNGEPGDIEKWGHFLHIFILKMFA